MRSWRSFAPSREKSRLPGTHLASVAAVQDVGVPTTRTRTVSLAGTVLLYSQSRPTEKPVKKYSIHSDGGYGVASLNDLWKISVIAEVEIYGTRPGVPPGTGGPEDLPKTLFDAQVLRILKSDERTEANPATITFSRVGGRVDRGDHIAEYGDDRFPSFAPKQTYIVFLRRDKQENYGTHRGLWAGAMCRNFGHEQHKPGFLSSRVHEL